MSNSARQKQTRILNQVMSDSKCSVVFFERKKREGVKYLMELKVAAK